MVEYSKSQTKINSSPVFFVYDSVINLKIVSNSGENLSVVTEDSTYKY